MKEKIEKLIKYLESTAQDDSLDVEAADMLRELQSRLESLEKDCCQLIDDRDERDEVIDALLIQVLGNECKEWSSAYDFNDAVIDVECKMKSLEKDAARLDWMGVTEGRYYNIDRISSVVGSGFFVGLHDKYPTLREAIDTAMQANKGE